VLALFLVVKFFGEKGEVITIHGSGGEARDCYPESLKITKALPEAETKKPLDQNFQRRDSPKYLIVLMVNLEPTSDFEHQRPQPERDMVQIRDQPSKAVKIIATQPLAFRNRFVEIFTQNVELFAWSPT
jgi:hypothetical protein